MTRDPHSDLAHTLYGLWRTAERMTRVNPKSNELGHHDTALAERLATIEDAARATNCWDEFCCLRGGMVEA